MPDALNASRRLILCYVNFTSSNIKNLILNSSQSCRIHSRERRGEAENRSRWAFSGTRAEGKLLPSQPAGRGGAPPRKRSAPGSHRIPTTLSARGRVCPFLPCLSAPSRDTAPPRKGMQGRGSAHSWAPPHPQNTCLQLSSRKEQGRLKLAS